MIASVNDRVVTCLAVEHAPGERAPEEEYRMIQPGASTERTVGIWRETKLDCLRTYCSHSSEPEGKYFMKLFDVNRPLAFHVFTLAVVCLLNVSLLNARTDAADVEFIVGGLMVSEGGTWDPKSSPLTSPFGVDFNAEGEMWIVELEGGRVHRFDQKGILHHAGGDGSSSYKGDGGPLSTATFNGMHNCAVTSTGDLYIGDSWNHCIRKVDAKTGLISTVAGTGKKGFSGDGGPATEATFDFVMCITLNLANDVIHVADLNNHRIRAVNLATGLVSTVAGNGKKGIPKDGELAADSALVDPRAVVQDSKQNIWILERGGHALRVVRPDGKIYTVAGTGKKGSKDGPALSAEFGSPKHLCIDDADNIFIADDENGTIRRVDATTHEVTTVLGKGQGDARIRLSHPHGVTWERGNLYVVDMGNNRILRIKP
jgi:sugar lactone lactonase YvrE